MEYRSLLRVLAYFLVPVFLERLFVRQESGECMTQSTAVLHIYPEIVLFLQLCALSSERG